MQLHNADAEKAILTAITQNTRLIPECMIDLVPESFFFEAHQRMYRVVVDLFTDGEAVDFVTIGTALQKAQIMDDMLKYLNDLCMDYAGIADISTHVQIVKDLYTRRRVYATAKKIIADCETDASTESITESAQASIFNATAATSRKVIQSTGQLIGRVMSEIQARISGMKKAGLPTGFHDLDEMLGGLQKKRLYVLAARPGIGKTSLALAMADHVAKNGATVEVFSLEMDELELMERLLSLNCRITVSTTDMETGKITEKQADELVNASERMPKTIYIDDTPDITIEQIHAKARLRKMQGGLDLVVIDYLQLISDSEKSESRRVFIGKVSRRCKTMAKDLDVPVLLLSQLTREPEKRANKEPQLSDLRESGDIEQDANVVMFITRDGAYDEEKDQTKAQILVRKNRGGPCGTVHVGWNGAATRFYDSRR